MRTKSKYPLKTNPATSGAGGTRDSKVFPLLFALATNLGDIRVLSGKEEVRL